MKGKEMEFLKHVFDCSTAVIEDDGIGKVHVAVGKSVDKAVELLSWALRAFPNREICILHLHQPSPWVPTPLGYLPASQASKKVLSAYRMDEKQKMRKLLFYYLTICSYSKVRVSVIASEAVQVQRGIVDLVSKYGISKLIMGADHESCMKVKGCSSKAIYVAKHAHQVCEIWFVNQGKYASKRDAMY